MKRLSGCMGLLLPLSLEKTVQDQANHADNIEDTLLHHAMELFWEITRYHARFNNTGVEIIYDEEFGDLE